MSFLVIGTKVEEITNITVEWDGVNFGAEVYLNAITKRFLKSLEMDEDANEKLIAKVFKSGDLSLDGQTKIEINLETLQDLPVSLLTAMGEAVLKARVERKNELSAAQASG